MRNPTIIFSKGIGVWLLGTGADARTSNATLTGHIPSEHQFAASSLMNGSSNYDENEERLPHGIDQKITLLTRFMTPANEAILELIRLDKGNEFANLDMMKLYIRRYSKIYPVKPPTLYKSIREHCGDPKAFSDLIEKAKVGPTHEKFAKQLEGLYSDTTPTQVLKALKLDNKGILGSDNLPELQEFIESYSSKNPRKQTTLYHTMTDCFEKHVLKKIIDAGLKRIKTKSVARQLNWMMTEKGPKELFVELQLESMKEYFRKHATQISNNLKSSAEKLNIDNDQLQQLNSFFLRCRYSDETNPINTPIDIHIKAFQENEWVNNNNAVKKFLTDKLYEAQFDFFRSDNMRDWIAYVNAYTKKPIDLDNIGGSHESYLLNLSTFEESDVIEILFRSAKLYQSPNMVRWINDLQVQWYDKGINPSNVFGKLRIAQESHFINSTRFQVWLYYVKSFGGQDVAIVEILAELVGSKKLKEAIEKATAGAQIEILKQDLIVHKLKIPGRDGKIFGVSKEYLDEIQDIQEMLNDIKYPSQMKNRNRSKANGPKRKRSVEIDPKPNGSKKLRNDR